jgi:tripartite ATP-independent transporter DctP family solute receptor
MKKIGKVVFAAVLACLLLAACLKTESGTASVPAQQQSSQTAGLTLKFAHFSNEMHPIHTGALEFAKNVREKTNGEITIDVYPNKELGSPMELLEQVSLGNIDFNTGTLSDMGRYSYRFYAVQTPFIFENYDHAHKVLDSADFAAWVQPDLDKNNFHSLGFWEYGFRNTTTNGKVINSPADLKGVKIRVPKVAQLEECFAALGAVTEKIDYNELYLAMKQGVADGQENPVGVIKADKLYEVQKQLAITNHMYESVLLIMNSGSWNKLSDAQKKIIEQEGRSCGDNVRNIIINSEKSDIEELKKFGMNVTYPDLNAFKSMMRSAYANIAKVCGQENIDTIVKLAGSVK